MFQPVSTGQKPRTYCLWLAKISDAQSNLPTEAQWEYAARSGGKFHPWATLTMYRQKARAIKSQVYLGKTPISDRQPESGFRCAVNSPLPID
ncbi:SUMF1/EgtB/PvdO family nonheme iron enzyme [Cupriavidus nantongensis]|uniref:SUMF1/EgtB/PvdO family nonheme iron enzyme n=1 Tax=Cupriavidus nantongensis TaxID=1796606 RepID=UPI0018D3211F